MHKSSQISLLPICPTSPRAPQLLQFVLSFRQTYLTSSRLIIFGPTLAQLVKQVVSSLPPASSTVELVSTYTAASEQLDASLPRDWPAEARHSSTILHRGAASNDGAFDLSSLAASLPSAASFANGDVAKPAATAMLVEAVEHPSALMLGPKETQNWTSAVVLVSCPSLRPGSLSLISRYFAGSRSQRRGSPTRRPSSFSPSPLHLGLLPVPRPLRLGGCSRLPCRIPGHRTRGRRNASAPSLAGRGVSRRPRKLGRVCEAAGMCFFGASSSDEWRCGYWEDCVGACCEVQGRSRPSRAEGGGDGWRGRRTDDPAELASRVCQITAFIRPR